MYNSIARLSLRHFRLSVNSCRTISFDLVPSDGSSINYRKGKLYRWNDILFASSFNEIVKIDPSKQDLSQYSIFREKNFIKSFDKGFYSLLPFVVRAYERLAELVDHEMQLAGCQKIIMPSIVGKHLWVKSERWDTSGDEILRVKDRHNNVFLPCSDLYTFDRDEDAAKLSYNKICKTYERIFKLLELPVLKTVGSTGSIGGKYSHEWLLETPLGEDEVYTCLKCNESFNAELLDVESHSDGDNVLCLNCKSDQLMPKRKALELGHCFLLSDRYSSKMGAFYFTENSNKSLPLQMGCYGLGLSRILAGSVEYLSSELQENIEIRNARRDLDVDQEETLIRNNIISLRWPKLIVPFKICMILPKKGSKEDRAKGTDLSLHLANVINTRFGEDILIDDRSNLTVGKRLLTAKAIGIPFVIVTGRNIIDDIPKFEVFHVFDDDSQMPGGEECSDPGEPLLLTALAIVKFTRKLSKIL